MRRRFQKINDDERVITDPERSRERTMSRAVKLLAAKPRSIGELRERLLEKNWTNAKIVSRVLERLKEYSYLDDTKFASDLALSKLRQKPQGKRRLQQSLSQKKLSKEDVETALVSAFEKMPETELIDAVIAKRLLLKGKPENHDDTKKFYDHLMRQGFDFDLIRSKMSAVAKREIIDAEAE